MSDNVERPEVERAVHNSAYELFVAALSVLAIVNVLLLLVTDPALQIILVVMNALFSVIFLIDFLFRARTTRSFSGYFLKQYGWADLLSSLPFPLFKILRLFRLIRAARLFRAAGGRATWARLKSERANSALMSLLLMGVLVLEFGSLIILRIEEYADGASIHNASDALWYVIVTIATVGYGDVHPVTNLGRIAGGVIIVIGVGIFGTFTGYLANFFLAPRRARRAGALAGDAADPVSTPARVAAEPSDVGVDDSARTRRLEALLVQSQAMVAELEALLGRDGDRGEPHHPQP